MPTRRSAVPGEAHGSLREAAEARRPPHKHNARRKRLALLAHRKGAALGERGPTLFHPRLIHVLAFIGVHLRFAFLCVPRAFEQCELFWIKSCAVPESLLERA